MLDEIKKLTGKIDKKALVGAIGLMLLSWAGLPIAYMLLVRKKKDTEEEK
jgi:hypothetical protein